ncbi:MAG: hypothetical protein EOO56_11780 [Hymenobacter sp.]|nr:MAG: hypothetical protein EOO56_11780 [Hymenobacter sp.]
MLTPAPRPGSDEEWKALLHQLRAQPKTQPRPFFYARVQARLLAPVGAGSSWRWLRRPAYAAVLSAMILAISGDGSVATPLHATAFQGSQSAQPPR